MAILAASTTNPGVTLQPGSKEMALTRSALDTAYQLQQAVSSVPLQALFRTYFAASFVVLSILFATNTIAARSYVASCFLIVKMALLSNFVKSSGWKAPKIKRLWKKVEMELFILLLGPAYSLFLLVFWPGWIVVGATIWGLCLWST